MSRRRARDPDHYLNSSSSRSRGYDRGYDKGYDRGYDRGYDSEENQTLSSARLAEHNRVFEKGRLHKSSAPQLDEDYRRQEHRRRRRHADHSPVVDASEQFLGVLRPRPSVNLTRSSYNDLRGKASSEVPQHFERPTTPSRRRRSSSAQRRDAGSRQSDYERSPYKRRNEDYEDLGVTSVVKLFGERPGQNPPPLPPAPHRSYSPYLEEVRRSSFASGRPESLYTADPAAPRYTSGRADSVFGGASSTAGDSVAPGRRRKLFGKSRNRDEAPPLPSINSGITLSAIQDREDDYRPSSRYRSERYTEDYLLPPQAPYTRTQSERGRDSFQSSRRGSADVRRSYAADEFASPKRGSRRIAHSASAQASAPAVAASPSTPADHEMATILSRFSSREMGDHQCKRGYPIAVFCGAQSMDVGGITNSKIDGAYALFFGPGHPQNVQQPMTEGELKPSHLQNPKPPTVAATGRRAELIATTRALQAVHELYRGKACAHICMDSAYVAKAWGSWIPKWEEEGWPGDEHIKKSYSHTGTGSLAAEDGAKKSNKRLADEDLLRELAAIRRLYARAERKSTGAAHLYLIDRNANPANKPCRLILENMRIRGVSPPPSPGAMSPGRRDSKRTSMLVTGQSRSRDLSNGTLSKRNSRREEPGRRASQDVRASRSGTLPSRRRKDALAEIDESNMSDIASAPLGRRISAKSTASAVTALDEDETGYRPAVTAIEGVEPEEEEAEAAAPAEPMGMLASGLASAGALLSAGFTYSGGLLARGGSPGAEDTKKVEAAVPDEFDSEAEEEVPAYSADKALAPVEKANSTKIPVAAVGSAAQSSDGPVLEPAAPIVVKKDKRSSKRATTNGSAAPALAPAAVIASPTKDSKRRKSKMTDVVAEKSLSPNRKSLRKKVAESPVRVVPAVAASEIEEEPEVPVTKPAPARRTLAERKRLAAIATEKKLTGGAAPVVVDQDLDSSSSEDEEDEDVAPTPKARLSQSMVRKSSATPVTPLATNGASASENMTDSEAEAGVVPMVTPKKSGIFGSRKRAAPVTPVTTNLEVPEQNARATPAKRGSFFTLLRRGSSAPPSPAPALTNAAVSPAALAKSQAAARAPASDVSALETEVTEDSEVAESAIEAPSVIAEEDEEAEAEVAPVAVASPAPVTPRLTSPEPPSGGRLTNYGRKRAEKQAAAAFLAPPPAAVLADQDSGRDASVVTVDEAAESELAGVPSSVGTNTESAARVPVHPSQRGPRRQASMPATRQGAEIASIAPSNKSSKSLVAGRFKSLSALGGRKNLAAAPEDEEWAKQLEGGKKKRGFMTWGKKGEKAPPVPALPASFAQKAPASKSEDARAAAVVSPESESDVADQTLQSKRSLGILRRGTNTPASKKTTAASAPVVAAEESPLEDNEEESELGSDLLAEEEEEDEEGSEAVSALEDDEAAQEVEETKPAAPQATPRARGGRILSFASPSANKKGPAASPSPAPASEPAVKVKPAKEPFGFKKSFSKLVALE